MKIRPGGCRLSPVENRIDAPRNGVQIRMLAAEEPKELVEAARHRMKLLTSAEMPLAEEGSPVASRPQSIRKSRFTQRQPELQGFGVEFMSEPLLVAPGQQPGARRTAIRTGDIRIGKADSASRQRVDVRCRNVLAAVHADIGVTHASVTSSTMLGPRLSQRDSFAATQEGDRNDEGRQASNLCHGALIARSAARHAVRLGMCRSVAPTLKHVSHPGT